MAGREGDPWALWYEAYLGQRAALKAARMLMRERRRASNLMAGLLLVYMLVGGLIASLAIGLVLAN